MNENKLKEWLYAEQRKAMVYGEFRRLNRINKIIYSLHCREKAKREQERVRKHEQYLERLAEMQIKNKEGSYDI